MVKSPTKKPREKNHGSPQTLFKLIPKERETRYGRRFFLGYNGTTYPDSTATRRKDRAGNAVWSYDIDDPEIARIILAAEPNQLGEFERISFRARQPWNSFERSVGVAHQTEQLWDSEGNWKGEKRTGFLEVRVTVEVPPEWSAKYSFLEFCNIVVSSSAKISTSVFTGEIDWDSLSITTLLVPQAEPLGTLISKDEELIDDIVTAALTQVETGEKSPGISQVFQFPDGIQTACKQYLLYFSEFLSDLGIAAQSSVHDQAGKVLFSVIPNDGVDALQRIKEALALYLKLPEEDLHFDESFAAMRLQQQIENLRHSQTLSGRELKLAQHVIDSQDRIINEKNSTIAQQERIIDLMKSSVMMDSAANRDELEEIYEGIRVGESEFLRKNFGIGLNPAKTLKAVGKRILGKADSYPSILDADDSTEIEKNG